MLFTSELSNQRARKALFTGLVYTNNQYQSISINRLILIIDDQSMAKIHVVIDWYRFPITIDRLTNIDWYRLVADFVTFQNLQADGIGTNITSLSSLYALIVNTFYLNALSANRRTILSSFSYYNAPSTCIRFPSKTQTELISVFACLPSTRIP